ncbi:TetR/AcrR family transcriptional regulator [Allonocardiopsis opalescens]|uniref:TetR family transcriptional regulator n=1 Tax=Allonocardiopsis opalescens TaxID=1144618 RepID=A0A2T0PY45_9ACTN|nr:TetR family transcriptional regulator C-terminal domain-containing protein [Allonocardiopsis opalescens]PRX96336.1 TetR family transcriptional regulator [Allonocardiopsis opalescens]
MPRKVDAEQRRQAVAEAVWRVIVRDGFGAASVRAVAVEAGLSAGSLRHYFSSQSALRAYALELIDQRMEARLAKVDRGRPPRQVIEDMMWALLPLDDASREEHRVVLAYMVQARAVPEYRHTVTAMYDEALALCRQAVDRLVQAGEAVPDTDAEAAAAELSALLDGVTLQAVSFPDRMPPERLRAVVRGWLDGLAAG